MCTEDIVEEAEYMRMQHSEKVQKARVSPCVCDPSLGE